MRASIAKHGGSTVYALVTTSHIYAPWIRIPCITVEILFVNSVLRVCKQYYTMTLQQRRNIYNNDFTVTKTMQLSISTFDIFFYRTERSLLMSYTVDH